MKYFSKVIITLFVITFACFSLCSIAHADNTVTSADQTTQNQTTTPSSQPSGQISTTVSTSTSAENEIFSITLFSDLSKKTIDFKGTIVFL